MNPARVAPELACDAWLNATEAPSIEAQRGRVIVLYAFQMLCAGCVQVALPQAQRIHEEFARDEVTVIGLHAVFERHAEMGRASLEKFVSEQRYAFPIAIDRSSPGLDSMPVTMQRYGFQGTPTMALIDRAGVLRKQKLGHEPDLRLGAAIGALLAADR